jgi:nucleoside-diphosphate-sugar epimerase
MKVLILGGTGFISGEIARLAAEAGHDVVLFNRGTAAPASPYRTLHGDVKALPGHAAALRAERAEIVVHALAGTEQAARDAEAVFGGLDTRLLVLGSMDVYDVFQAAIRGKEVSDHPVDEASAITAIRYYYRDLMPGDARREDYDKNLMTAALMDAHARGALRASVFRCPMVWGPEDKQFAGRHGYVLRRLVDGRDRLVMGLQDQGRLWTFGYVTNVAAAIVHAFDRPVVDGRIYNVGERTYRTKRRWAELYAEAAGVALDVRLLPDELLERDPAARNAAPMHLLVDSSRYAADTGFHDPVPLPDAIAHTLAWARAHPDALGPSPDYAAEDRLLAAYGDAMAALAPNATTIP